MKVEVSGSHLRALVRPALAILGKSARTVRADQTTIIVARPGRLDALTFAEDMRVQNRILNVKVLEQGAIVCDLRALAPALTQLKGQVTVSMPEAMLLLETPGHRLRVKATITDDWPDWTPWRETRQRAVDIDTKQWRTALQTVGPFVSRDYSRGPITGMHLLIDGDLLQVQATEGCGLARLSIPIISQGQPGPGDTEHVAPESVILPEPSIGPLKALARQWARQGSQRVRLQWDARTVLITQGTTTDQRCLAFTPMINGDYPDLSGIVDAEGFPEPILINREGLRNALGICQAMDPGGATRKVLGGRTTLTMQPDPNDEPPSVVLHVNTEYGSSRAPVLATFRELPGPELHLGVNYLRLPTAASKAETLELSCGSGNIVRIQSAIADDLQCSWYSAIRSGPHKPG